MSREAFEAAAHDCLTALAGVETHDIDLRDHPQAWHAIEAFAAAAQADAFERAARVCDALAQDWRGANSQIKECADAIRVLAKEAIK